MNLFLKQKTIVCSLALLVVMNAAGCVKKDPVKGSFCGNYLPIQPSEQIYSQLTEEQELNMQTNEDNYFLLMKCTD